MTIPFALPTNFCKKVEAKVILVDIHAEATSEKDFAGLVSGRARNSGRGHAYAHSNR